MKKIIDKSQETMQKKLALCYANEIISTFDYPFLVLDENLKIISANSAFFSTFKLKKSETLNQFLPELNHKDWNIPKLMKLLREILPKKRIVVNLEVEKLFKDIGNRILKLNARKLCIPKMGTGGGELMLLSIEDVTVSKGMEGRYKGLFSASRDAIMTLEPPSWRFTSGNPATVKLFKAKSEAEFLRFEPWRLSPKYQPDGQASSKKAKKMIEIAMRDGANFFEWMHKKVNGEEFFANVLLSKVGEGDKAFLHATVRDITEQKKTEIALVESEARFMRIFNEVDDGILLAEPRSKKFLIGNKSIALMLGYEVDEISGLGVKDIHPKKDLAFVLAQFEKQAKGKLDVAKDLPMQRKDGSIFYADIIAKSVQIAGKSYQMGFFRDITKEKELKAMTQRVQDAKERVILESIGEGVVACDEKGVITLCNHAAARLMECEVGDVVGRKYKDVFSFVVERNGEVVKDFIAATIRKGIMTLPTVHTMIVKGNGKKLSVSDCAAPIFDDAGKINGCVVVFHDVSKEREIDRTKSEFVSIASHQLRTPLTGIQWLTELLRRERLTKSGHEYLDDITANIKRLNVLVELLLNVSRIEEGSVSISPQPVEIVGFTQKAVDNLALLYKNKNLSFIFKPSVKKLIVTTDLGAFQNIIQAIIPNAIEYTSAGGKITIDIKRRRSSFLVIVADTGVGIPKKDQGIIFKKFARASNAQRVKAGGMGLGLWIAKKATLLLGGKIWFESKENNGSTFFVELPMKSKEVEGLKKMI